VAWKSSTNSDLWVVPYSINQTGDLTITNIASNVAKEATHGWNNVNGGPSTTEEFALTARHGQYLWDFAWQDSRHDIDYASAPGPLTKTGDPHEWQVPFPLSDKPADRAASAPSIGYWASPLLDPLFHAELHIYYKGQDGFLHEFLFNQSESSKGWQDFSYPQLGKLG